MSHTQSSDGSSAIPPAPGVYVPVPTFFVGSHGRPGTQRKTSEQLDLETQSKHSLFLMRGGIKGLVLLGSSGEAILLNRQQRIDLIRSQRETLNTAGYKDAPIIAGTASQNIDETIELIAESKTAGAAYAMVLAPGFFASATSQSGIQQWYETVAEHAALPIMIYHYPGVTNNIHISATTFEKLSRHPNIVGTKQSHGNLDDVALIAASPRIDHEHFATFSGLGQTLLPVLAVGGAGVIDGLAGCFPKVVVGLWELYQRASSKEDWARMRELQFRICEGEKLIARWGVVGIKEMLARTWGYGVGKAACLPLGMGFEDGEKEWQKWTSIFAGLKELEESM